MERLSNYMGYLWVERKDGNVTVGINDSGIDELSEITDINLPQEDEEVEAEQVIGEINTDSGPLNLYTPVTGKIVEINEAVVENPQIIFEDNYGDGWLFRIEASDDIDEEEEDDDDDGDNDEEEDYEEEE